MSVSQSVPVRVLAARALLEAGEIIRARKLADGLASEIQPETQAYAKIIRGDLALQSGDKNEAINMFTGANQLVDTWIGRFELGRAYLEAGMFVEADSEFDRCMKRRGEALEIFQDGTPTFAYFPPVYYYQGRVREGLKSPGAAEPFRTYLNIRGKAKEDPLLFRRSVYQGNSVSNEHLSSDCKTRVEHGAASLLWAPFRHSSVVFVPANFDFR